jgi:hypothetical protein
MLPNVDAIWQQRAAAQRRLTTLTAQRRHLHDVPDTVYTTPQDIALKAEELDYLITLCRERITELGNRICDAHARTLTH